MKNRTYKDFRLFFVASCLWGTALCCHLLPSSPVRARVVIVAEGALALVFFFGLGICCGAREDSSRLSLGLYLIVGSLCVSCMVINLSARQAVDRAYGLEVGESAIGKEALFLLHAQTPALTSDRRGFTCKIDGEVEAWQYGGSVLSVRQPIRAYARSPSCPWEQGGYFWVRGTVSQATYGKAPLWLTASQAKASSGEKSTGVPATTRVRSPHRGLTVIHRMQEAFLDQSRRLSPQGQILLPGLTLGVLGTDAVVGGSDPSVPQAYLSRVKDSYLNLGMMHLMAVSGSHFVLVSGLLGWILVRCQWRRKATGGIQALAFCLLAVCMYPSDSVIRALIMGLLAILALCRGRISSSFACLNLTVCLVLTFRPEFAWSYGFSLSVTAVYGIILFHRPCSAFLSRRLPGWLAQGLSMTICAQVLSLPISLLMQPSLPLLSPIANVMVAPFVEGATILGIAAFAIAWAAPRLAYALLWLGSGCTQVMNQISLWLADRPWCSLPWPQGLAGVGALFASYAVIILTYAVVKLFLAVKRSQTGTIEAGTVETGTVKAGTVEPDAAATVGSSWREKLGMGTRFPKDIREEVSWRWKEIKDAIFAGDW